MVTIQRVPASLASRGRVAFGAIALASCAAAVILGGLASRSGTVDADDEHGHAAVEAARREAKRLFEEETFGGNGRTCLTCHGAKTGTVSPDEALERFLDDPNDPLFKHDGSDDLQGNGVARMISDATILVRIPLPPGVTLAGDPTAAHVVVRRGIPTTLDSPALDPVLMVDGRAPNLEAQALDAIHGHAQNQVEPTAAQLELIALHQKTKPFFTSPSLRKFFEGGPPPELPAGRTESEQRGRLFFEDAPIGPQINQQSSRRGLCAICHSGPMLNESNGFNPLPVPPFFVPKGTRFQSVLVSELNHANNPVYDFVIHHADGTTSQISSPDPGISLINGNFTPFPFGQFSNFKIPTLWGVKHTAPYFHDNSRKTLEDAIEHYAEFFRIATEANIDGDPPLVLTAQDKADLVAYLKRL